MTGLVEPKKFSEHATPLTPVVMVQAPRVAAAAKFCPACGCGSESEPILHYQVWRQPELPELDMVGHVSCARAIAAKLEVL